MLEPRAHLSATLGLYAVLLLGWASARLARPKFVRPQNEFHWVIAALTPVAALLFFVRLHAKDLRVDSCSFASALHVSILVVDFIFFTRLLIELLEGHMPEPVPSLTEGWLLVNTIWKLTHRAVINEYHFLVLVRFAYPQTLEVFAALLTRLFGVSVKQRLFQLTCIIVGVCVFAGAVQTAEEWSVLLGIHPDDEGQATVWHSFWDYIYMGYVSVSTVGFGDMTPSTAVSQVIVVATIVGYIAWYTNNCQELFGAFLGTLFNIARHMPALPRLRRLLIVGCLEENETQQLVKYIVAQDEIQIIIGISRDETLSLEQVPGVYVIAADLDRRFLKRCFPKQNNSAVEGPSYEIMILNQQGDADEVEARNSDLRVMSLIQLVKAEVPDVTVVAQVWRSETHEAVLDIEGWSPAQDQVVCYEELMAGLITQGVAAEGAASILATLMACPPCTKLFQQVHKCTEKITQAHIQGQRLALALAEPDSMEGESVSFKQAALQSYQVNGILLLGYVHDGNENPGEDDCSVLPSFLPPNARRIVIAPLNPVTNGGPGLVTFSQSNSRAPNIDFKQKTVRVLRDGPAGWVSRGVSRAYLLRKLADEEENSQCDTAAMMETQHCSSLALFNYYYEKAELSETSPWARLMTNVEHGLRPGTWKVSAGNPHSSTSFVNPCFVTSAVNLAHHSNFLFSVWKFLVQDCPLVEVEVKGYYCYGNIFQFLLMQRHMLALGATVQLSSHSCDACSRLLHLDPEDKGSLAVVNPDSQFCLHPGDKVVAFQFKGKSHSM